MSFTALTEDPLDVARVIAVVSHAGAGAVATFVGVVRDHSGGKPVERLEYHVYRDMAETELRAIAAELESERAGVRVACVHRIGELLVGDAAVVCAASAAHREDAFWACRELIDRVKSRVPIWKREHAGGEAHWVGWQDARTQR